MKQKLFSLLFLSLSLLSTIVNGQTSAELVKSGDLKLKAKNYTEAVKDYSIAISGNEARTEDYLKRINYYNALNEDRKAQVDTASTFEGKNDVCGPFYKRGLVLMILEKPTEARQDFEMVLKLDPNHGGAHLQMGLIEKAKGNKEQACSCFGNAIRYGDKSAQDEFDAYFCWNISMDAYREGLSQLNLKHYTEAIEHFNKALKLSADSFTYMRRGLAYCGLEQYDKALSDMNSAVRIAPRNIEIAYNRGLLYLKMDKNQEAFDDFSRAVTANPNYYKALEGRALACEELGQKKSAAYDYTTMIKLKPDDGLPYYRRGLIRDTDMEDHKGACADFKKALDLGVEEATDRQCKEKLTYKQKMDAIGEH